MSSQKQITPCKDCDLCARLVEFRKDNQSLYPTYFNAPVPCFGNQNAQIMLVGLAPGLQGANQTGRPFTNDFAGILLYDTIDMFNLSSGKYQANADDGLELTGIRIVNAVRCVPPANKVNSSEIANCNQFLQSEISNMPNLKILISLGTVAHTATLQALGKKAKDYKFGHGNIHKIDDYVLVNSYHCSKYNTSTKRLTAEMFQDIFRLATDFLK